MYFDMQYRVPYADTDQMGVVYYANYLEYFERSRTEMFRAVGMPYSLMEERGYFLPVAEASCKYLGSAHYDDLLTLRSYVEEYSRVRVRLASEVLRGEELLVRGHVVLGCVNREFRITRMPDWMIRFCDLCKLPDAEEKS